jgi:TonB family protein
MAARNKPYEQFGPYILFKKMEADALGDLWRAGKIDGGQLGPTLALRRLSGGNREAFTAAAEAASLLLPQLTGTSFARDQVAGVIGGVPFLAWDYQGGRSLRYLIDRSRGNKDVPANPLPIDQAIVIAEKVALSLATTAELRDGTGARLWHGGLVPQFVWISDDGEIRVGGQQLGGALTGSLSDPKIGAELGRYLSPEYRASGQIGKTGDVYSMGAILFLLVTGHEPPDAATASAFGAAVRAAKTATGASVPDDIRVILDKSFNIDPSMRYASMTEMKQALTTLAHSGKYSATTFNLAFYLSNLLKKEMESEAAERDKESRVSIAAYLETPQTSPAPAPAAVPDSDEPMFMAEAPARKSKVFIAVAAAVGVAAIGVGGYMMVNKPAATPAVKQPVVTAQTLPAAPPQKPVVMPEPIVTLGSPETVTTGTLDPAAQQKAFEEAVRQRMQSPEIMRLQNQFMAELKQKQSKNAPVTLAPEPELSSAEEASAMTAAVLDQQRREAAATRTETTEPQPTATMAATQTQAPAPVLPPVTQTQAPAPAPAPVATVREGDVVDFGSLDVIPRPLRTITPLYPTIARQQRISARIVVSAFVTEQGQVTDVRVLSGDARFGLNDAAVRAMRAARFSPAMKDGKKVRTWMPQTFDFRP